MSCAFLAPAIHCFISILYEHCLCWFVQINTMQKTAIYFLTIVATTDKWAPFLRFVKNDAIRTKAIVTKYWFKETVRLPKLTSRFLVGGLLVRSSRRRCRKIVLLRFFVECCAQFSGIIWVYLSISVYRKEWLCICTLLLWSGHPAHSFYARFASLYTTMLTVMLFTSCLSVEVLFTVLSTRSDRDAKCAMLSILWTGA